MCEIWGLLVRAGGWWCKQRPWGIQMGCGVMLLNWPSDVLFLFLPLFAAYQKADSRVEATFQLIQNQIAIALVHLPEVAPGQEQPKTFLSSSEPLASLQNQKKLSDGWKQWVVSLCRVTQG
ncbi:hypothetical protein BOTBODRAFT_426714 [Botryobasidium botryosum FD-172 SS1]|uniref:Uncharacterized protein n=1 Tax=Botryobasidium botryosum (strain FD-172 SS1) TaxID=930990 RepID=A0A067MK00_BOTB1|nr:hypothetical protein BOTBODRAFT_426714 [Botryobasidium botryosum FD-172 SS1]